MISLAERPRSTHFNAKHGAKGTREYKIWDGMKQRCHNPNCDCFDRYGGRGIKVCERWRTSFDNFISDMGLPPSLKHQIDRIDNDGDYTPENCRWATCKDNQRNKSSNRLFTAFGETKPISAWVEDVRCKVYHDTLIWRIEHWTDAERCITTPPRPMRGFDKRRVEDRR